MFLTPKCENYIIYKCTHFLLFLSLSTVIIHQFHSYTKILTLVPRIPTIPTLIPRIPIIPLIHFPDSPFWLLQIAK